MEKETIQINKADARKAYEQADSALKPVLENLLGKSNLVPADITERVKSYKDARAVLGLPSGSISVSCTSSEGQSHITAMLAFGQLRTIAKALNEGWEPDWGDSNQAKYYPWFENTGAGFRFGGCDFDYQFSAVGSRLCFKSRALAEYAGKQFEDLYNQMFSL